MTSHFLRPFVETYFDLLVLILLFITRSKNRVFPAFSMRKPLPLILMIRKKSPRRWKPESRLFKNLWNYRIPASRNDDAQSGALPTIKRARTSRSGLFSLGGLSTGSSSRYLTNLWKQSIILNNCQSLGHLFYSSPIFYSHYFPQLPTKINMLLIIQFNRSNKVNFINGVVLSSVCFKIIFLPSCSL